MTKIGPLLPRAGRTDAQRGHSWWPAWHGRELAPPARSQPPRRRAAPPRSMLVIVVSMGYGVVKTWAIAAIWLGQVGITVFRPRILTHSDPVSEWTACANYLFSSVDSATGRL